MQGDRGEGVLVGVARAAGERSGTRATDGGRLMTSTTMEDVRNDKGIA